MACNGSNYDTACKLADQVDALIQDRLKDRVPTVEQIQDIVEYVLIENRHSQTAKAFILYREKRKSARENNALIGATIDLFDKYIPFTTVEQAENICKTLTAEEIKNITFVYKGWTSGGRLCDATRLRACGRGRESAAG